MASSPPSKSPSTSSGSDSTDPPSTPPNSEPSTLLASRLSPLRSVSDPPSATLMTTSSTPLGSLNAARHPRPPPTLAGARSGGLPQDMQAKMKAFHLSRQGTPPAQSARRPSGGQGALSLNAADVRGGSVTLPTGAAGTAGSPIVAASSPSAPTGALVGGIAALHLPPSLRPQAQNWTSAPAVAGTKLAPKQGLGARRGMKLPGGLPGPPPSTGSSGGAGQGPGTGDPNAPASLNQLRSGGLSGGEAEVATGAGSLFNKFSEYVDTNTGTLKFAGKAVIHGKGVDFSSGSSFSISLDEVDTLEELGKGNYGTVFRVRHSRPHVRRPGLGLQGNRASHAHSAPAALTSTSTSTSTAPATNETTGDLAERATESATAPRIQGDTTDVIMAMKEIRLELDEAKFAAIIMELDILHRCVSPFIVDFYGAFFQEGAVYICMEYMDGGSIDKLYGDGIPEQILRKIALSTVMGLKALKEEHNIIHRDVKPTNILVNTRGQVKICDFGVSGNLVASIAKTNIGCQSYMAPERIATGGVPQAGANPPGGTYSVQSDIWSLGLTIIECAMGRYPYPPETYNNIFSQLSAIVDGDPPDLPSEGYSASARDFVRGCLHKTPKLRPTYAMLLRHGWLAPLLRPPTDVDPLSGSKGGFTTLEHTSNGFPDTADEEVATWVGTAIERRRSGTMGKSDKPALHAAPLDAIHSPPEEKKVDFEASVSTSPAS
ncbi:MAG: hypothetical protein M1838_000354 [Thelocarpon superellum]|nr:MAG: hypothetical protein M1838_000354 [Thelocarpon superellum]